jgi:hypothetical protein
MVPTPLGFLYHHLSCDTAVSNPIGKAIGILWSRCTFFALYSGQILVVACMEDQAQIDGLILSHLANLRPWQP